jgi:hypothetical protein
MPGADRGLGQVWNGRGHLRGGKESLALLGGEFQNAGREVDGSTAGQAIYP